MSLACGTNRARLAARRAGLPEAERLALEAHLEGCAACRAEAQTLDALVAASDAGVVVGARSERALLRSITQAVRDAGDAGAPAAARIAISPPRAWPRLTLGLGVGLGLAAVTVAFLVARPAHEVPLGAAAVVPVVAPTAPRDVPAGREVALAHGRVQLSPGGVARWQPATRTVELVAGRLDVIVDPAPGTSFQVQTPRFTVEVLGTAFAVTLDAVEVSRGRVRVVAPDGTVLAEGLSAGGRWALAATATAAAPPATPALAPPEPPSRAPSPPPAAAPEALLAEARTHLAAGDPARARRLVERALAKGPGRAARAEAETLLAECLLVGGDAAAAATGYARVAERYTDLPAGESALYAAAAASARAGQRTEARALAERYLTRYPRGRFRTEAAALR